MFPQASLVAQMVKKLPAVWETQGSIPGWGRPPGEGNGNFPVFVPVKFHGWRNLAGYTVHGNTESDTTEQLTLLLFILRCLQYEPVGPDSVLGMCLSQFNPQMPLSSG